MSCTNHLLTYSSLYKLYRQKWFVYNKWDIALLINHTPEIMTLTL